MISKKGFFFTFAVILFASTLVFLTQDFSEKMVLDEKLIVQSYKPSVIPFINDDISFDLKRILDFDTTVDFNKTDLTVNISDSLSKETDVSVTLNDYESFLNDYYFSRTQGTKSTDFSNLVDGAYEVLYGNSFTYSNNYDSDVAKFISNEEYLVKEIDLNLSTDEILVGYSWIANYGEDTNAIVRIIYSSDTNNFEFIENFDPTEQAVLDLNFGLHSVDINFGLIDSVESSLMIDSDIDSKTDYDLVMVYSFDKNELPVNFNSTIDVSIPSIESSSLINLKK